MEKQQVIELKGITKIFGRIVANHDCNLSLYNGEILSLLGENGSGKTTLMNALAGIYCPDAGDIYVNGEKVRISSPHDAYKYHIGMVHQHFKLVDTFTAVENVVVGLTKKDLVIERHEGNKTYYDNSNIMDAEEQYQAIATMEVFDEILVKYTKMTLNDLIQDIDLNQDEVGDFGTDLTNAIMGKEVIEKEKFPSVKIEKV